VHDVGSKFGPPADQIDAEVVIQFVGHEGSFGFQLRDDGNRPARQGMVDLLRDAFNHGWRVNIDYNVDPPKKRSAVSRLAHEAVVAARYRTLSRRVPTESIGWQVIKTKPQGWADPLDGQRHLAPSNLR
jgi:hypothetical protein